MPCPAGWVEVFPLVNAGTRICYTDGDGGLMLEWGDHGRLVMRRDQVDAVVAWIHQNGPIIGSSQDRPAVGGLGARLRDEYEIAPRYASALAPVLVDLGRIAAVPYRNTMRLTRPHGNRGAAE